MSVLKLKNRYLVGLGSWLNELQLAGKESRERTRFVNLIIARIGETDKFREAIVDKYVKKDKNGEKVKKVLENGTEVWDISGTDMKAYEKEYQDLMDDVWNLDVLEGNKEKLKVVQDIVLNTEYKFGPKEGNTQEEKIANIRQAADYEIWCDAFEEIKL